MRASRWIDSLLKLMEQHGWAFLLLEFSPIPVKQ